MKNSIKIAAVTVALLGLVVILISPVTATFNGTVAPPPCKGDHGGDRISALLQNLTEQGYDVSDISAAVQSGDLQTAHTLLRQFIDDRRDAMPAPPDGNGHRESRTGNGLTTKTAA